MKLTSLIDIVIPVYNRATVVMSTLESIERQRVMPSRVILVDNNSTDSTLDVLNGWADKMKEKGVVVKVVTESTPGAAAARNRGLDEVTAPYVMFFDSDDVMSPDHVESFSNFFELHPQVELAGKSTIMTLLDGSVRKGLFTTHAPLFDNLFRSICATQRIVATRSLYERAGRWNSKIKGWNDIEIGQRLLLLNPKIGLVPGQPTVKVTVMSDSITEKSFSRNPSKWETALDEMRRSACSAGRESLVNHVDCRRMILAANYEREGDHASAARLKKNVYDDNPAHARLSLIYGWQRRFGRLTWVLARLFF